jgi:hypothetical protein
MLLGQKITTINMIDGSFSMELDTLINLSGKIFQDV